MRYRRNTEETNFWAGYADCMLALFMIALLLWILSAGITTFTNEENKVVGDLKDQKIEELQKEIKGKDEEILALTSRMEKLKDLVGKGLDLSDELKRLKVEYSKLSAEHSMLQKRFKDLNLAHKGLQVEYDALLAQKNALANKYEVTLAENTRLKEDFEGVDIDTLLKKLATLEKEINDKPPIINLTDGVTREFSFPSGKAILPPEFLTKLHEETFPELQKILKNYPSIDTLEIVGHTDGSPIDSKGNLDLIIPELMMTHRIGKKSLKPGSNADLGLMRALSIRNAWYNWVESQTYENHQKLTVIKLRCYSAAQTVRPNSLPALNKEDYLANDPNARRIEIRFTQLEPTEGDQ